MKHFESEISGLIDSAIKQFRDHKEAAIKERIEKLGYTFADHNEYLIFVRSRCVITFSELTGFYVLNIDGMPRFGWKEETSTDMGRLEYKIYFTE